VRETYPNFTIRLLARIGLIALCMSSCKVAGAFPNASNTGPVTSEAGLAEYTGPTTIKVDGTVIEGVKINSRLRIEANDVTIRDFTLQTGGFYGIQIIGPANNVLIEDGRIENMKSAAIIGSNFRANRLEIRNSGNDGIKAQSNFIVENCWFRELGYLADAHADGIQMVQGANGLIQGNYFDMPHDLPGYKNSQCIIIQTNNGPISQITIRDNLINGGGYAVQIRDKGKGHGKPTDMKLIDNTFGRDFQFGPLRIDDDTTEIHGNAWLDTGELLDNQDQSPAPLLQAQEPSISPAEGPYFAGIEVELSSGEAGAEIRYTVDGSQPGSDSALYQGPFSLAQTSTVKAITLKSGLLDSSVSEAAFQIGSFETTDAWSNLAFPTEDEFFTIEFEVEPKDDSAHLVVGASSGPASVFNDLGPIVRLNEAGFFDARNGGSYQSQATVPHQSNTAYLVKMHISVIEKEYSVTVTPQGGAPALIASGFAFRTQQQAVEELDNLAYTAVGTSVQTLSGIEISADEAPISPSNLQVTPSQ